MGFYPVCPGTDQYVLGAPLFKKVTVKLENGKTLTINAPANSAQNRYIGALSVNGKVYNSTWLSHKELLTGARLDFQMTDKANTLRGTSMGDAPYSFSSAKK